MSNLGTLWTRASSRGQLTAVTVHAPEDEDHVIVSCKLCCSNDIIEVQAPTLEEALRWIVDTKIRDCWWVEARIDVRSDCSWGPVGPVVLYPRPEDAERKRSALCKKYVDAAFRVTQVGDDYVTK